MLAISSHEYAARRAALASAIGPDAVAVLRSPPPVTRSRDTHYTYRPSSDVLYLCGFEEPDAILVIAPGHEDGEFVMFVPKRDPVREQWEGVRAGAKGAERDYGADRAFALDEVATQLPRWLAGRDTIHCDLSDASLTRELMTWSKPLRRRSGLPPANPQALRDLSHALHPLRMLKSEEEVAIITRACELSARAHARAMRAGAPGLYEYQLQALLEYHFAMAGASAPAYTSIVAGGSRANILHYTTNRERLEEGELVLIDAGAELCGYASDITRTWPVDGKFSPAQRDVYQAVERAHGDAIAAAKPGITHAELHMISVRAIARSLRDLGVLASESVDAIVETKSYHPYYPHGVGHWMGLDVHDVGSYYDGDGSRTLEQGHVLTIEPGLYLPDSPKVPEALRGIGVRIEDNILITSSGARVLTSGCPTDVEAIEAIVGSEPLEP